MKRQETITMKARLVKEKKDDYEDVDENVEGHKD